MTVAGSSVIGTKARSHGVEEIGGFGADPPPPDSEGKALGVVSLGETTRGEGTGFWFVISL